MDPAAGVDRCSRSPDRPAVLAHDFAFGQRAERDLVPGRHRLARGDADVTDGDDVARLQRIDGDGDVVRRADTHRAREAGRCRRHAEAPASAAGLVPAPFSEAVAPKLYVSRASS